jgi:tetratricopeptide (TPR) repeat protein
MRKLSLTSILLVCLFVFTNIMGVNGQDKSSADVQFELEAYDLAIEGYLAHLENVPDDEDAIYKLALAYERTNELVRSARMFERLFLLNADRPDEHKIGFGKILKSLGLIDHAEELFMACGDPDFKWEAEQLIEGCRQAKFLLQQDDPYQVFQFLPNTERAEFAPAIWNDKLVFASFSDESEMIKDENLDIFHSPSNLLYQAELSRKAKADDIVTLGTDLTIRSGISSCSFSNDGKKVLYTKNKFKNSNKQIRGDEKGMSVYLADVDEQGGFFNDYALPFNSTDYSVAFACFGEDMGEIIFAYNSHGDHKDFDLYQTYFNGVEWEEPVNLGPGINTPGNEVTPYYHDGMLYFASDLIPGIGGFDLFKTEFSNLTHGLVMNLGKGVNSLEDDLYLISDELGNFYFTSNRIGGRGNYDLYVAVEDPTSGASDMLMAYNEINQDDIPKAVSLNDLEERNSVPVNHSMSTAVGYNENEILNDDVSLEGAVMVSYGEVIKSASRVYFIQLASLSTSTGNVNMFRDLVAFGNVYRVHKDNSYKIRLGYFHGQAEAKSILSQIKKEGFSDAFVVEDVLNTRELELLLSSFTFNENEKYESPETESSFKVRLAAYSNPLYFDTEKVKDIGIIEQWSKGDWTIFILSGFDSLEAAQSARIKAINRGFTGAEIVKDDNGILSRVKIN